MGISRKMKSNNKLNAFGPEKLTIYYNRRILSSKNQNPKIVCKKSENEM